MGGNPLMSLTQHNASRYTPWLTEVSGLRCPSDPMTGLPAGGRTNYVACTGDTAYINNLGAAQETGLSFVSATTDLQPLSQDSCRGVFTGRRKMSFRNVLDGTANTICADEIPTDNGDMDKRTHGKGDGLGTSGLGTGSHIRLANGALNCAGFVDPLRPQFWGAGLGANVGTAEQRRGFQWAAGRPLYGQCNTILPPNREICIDRGSGGVLNNHGNAGIVPPGSRHQGGCHVLMTDGAVKFITDSIEAGSTSIAQSYTGSATQPGSKSPFGLWGALGTRASSETIDKEF